jgi:hypothetical protein
MNTSLTLTLNQLASLIGSFAFPDPDGDDSLVHGPGGPRVRTSVLAEIRRVTIAVTQWAERLGEQAMLSASAEGHNLPTAPTGSGTAKTRSANSKAEGKSSSTSDDCDDPTTDTVKGTQPPGVAMSIIKPPICHFVSDFMSDRPVRLPLAAGADTNPWTLSLSSEKTRTAGLLVAGAQFLFAAQATQFGRLRELFAWAATELIAHGLRRLDPRSTGLTAAAV